MTEPRERMIEDLLDERNLAWSTLQQRTAALAGHSHAVCYRGL